MYNASLQNWILYSGGSVDISQVMYFKPSKNPDKTDFFFRNNHSVTLDIPYNEILKFIKRL